MTDDMTNEETDEPTQEIETDDPDELKAIIYSLREDVKAAHARAAEEKDAFLRERAAFLNFKRRTEDEKETLRQYLNRDLLTRLLPVVDNFERALVAAAQTREFEKMVAGVDSTYRALLQYLEREGVTPIAAVGEPFDPEKHNAVLREETADVVDDTILEELQKGYYLGDKVLRPTMVKVATSG